MVFFHPSDPLFTKTPLEIRCLFGGYRSIASRVDTTSIRVQAGCKSCGSIDLLRMWKAFPQHKRFGIGKSPRLRAGLCYVTNFGENLNWALLKGCQCSGLLLQHLWNATKQELLLCFFHSSRFLFPLFLEENRSDIFRKDHQFILTVGFSLHFSFFTFFL